MNRLHSRRNNYQSHHRGSYKPQAPKEPFQEIPGAAFFLGKLNKNHDREHIYNELKKLTRTYSFYIRKLDMPYADKTRRAGNMGYAFVHTRSAAEAKRIVSMKTLKLGHQVCEVKVYGGRTAEEGSTSTSEAFSGRTSPEMSEQGGGFVNPLKLEAESPEKSKITVWDKANIADIVRPRTDSGCQTRNVSECEENNKEADSKLTLADEEQEKNHYDHDQQIPVCSVAPADSEMASYNNSQLALDLALVRNHVGDSEQGIQLFMQKCDLIYNLLQNASPDVIYQTAQIARIQV